MDQSSSVSNGISKSDSYAVDKQWDEFSKAPIPLCNSLSSANSTENHKVSQKITQERPLGEVNVDQGHNDLLQIFDDGPAPIDESEDDTELKIEKELGEKKFNEFQEIQTDVYNILFHFPILEEGSKEKDFSVDIDTLKNDEGKVLKDFLEEKGYSFLGQGSYGSVFRKGNFVIKINVGRYGIPTYLSSDKEKLISGRIRENLYKIRKAYAKVRALTTELKKNEESYSKFEESFKERSKIEQILTTLRNDYPLECKDPKFSGEIKAFEENLHTLDVELYKHRLGHQNYKKFYEERQKYLQKLTELGGITLGEKAENVLKTYDGLSHILIQEYMPGKEYTRVPLLVALRSAIQMAQGISGLHQAGFMHNDLNFGNFLHRSVWTDASGEVIALRTLVDPEDLENSREEISDPVTGQVWCIYDEKEGELYDDMGQNKYAIRNSDGEWEKLGEAESLDFDEDDSKPEEQKIDEIFDLLKRKQLSSIEQSKVIDFGLSSEGMQRKGFGTPIFGGMLEVPYKDELAVLTMTIDRITGSSCKIGHISKGDFKEVVSFIDFWKKAIDAYFSDENEVELEEDYAEKNVVFILRLLLDMMYPNHEGNIGYKKSYPLTAEQLVEIFTVIESMVSLNDQEKIKGDIIFEDGTKFNIFEEQDLTKENKNLVDWVYNVVKKVRNAHFIEYPLALTKEYDEARRALDDKIVAQCEEEMLLMEDKNIDYRNSIYYGVVLLHLSCSCNKFEKLSKWVLDHVETALRLLFRADVQGMDPSERVVTALSEYGKKQYDIYLDPREYDALLKQVKTAIPREKLKRALAKLMRAKVITPGSLEETLGKLYTFSRMG